MHTGTLCDYITFDAAEVENLELEVSGCIIALQSFVENYSLEHSDVIFLSHFFPYTFGTKMHSLERSAFEKCIGKELWKRSH